MRLCRCAIAAPCGAFRAGTFCWTTLAEVDSYHRSLDALDEAAEPPQPASKLWTKTTQATTMSIRCSRCSCAWLLGSEEDAAHRKAAASLVRRIRKSMVAAPLAAEFIQAHAPGVYQDDYLALWNGFVQEATKP